MAQVEFLDDGECPLCGKGVLHASELESPVEIAESEQSPLDQQVSPSEAGLIEDARNIESSPVASAPTFGFLGAVGWCLMLLVAQASLGCVLGIPLALTGLIESVAENRATLGIVMMVIGHLLMLAMGWNQLTPDVTGKLALRRISLFHLFILVLMILPMAVLAEDIGNRVGNAFDLFFGTADELLTTAYVGLGDEFFEMLALQPWSIVFLVGCLLPGICEEVFFRGFLGRALLARYGVIGGVTLTSLLFGLMHFDPVQACYTFVVGIVLHCVYLWTRTFWAPMVLHTSFNLSGFSTQKLQLDGILVIGGPGENLWIQISLSAASVVAIIALGYLLYQSRIRFQMADEENTLWTPGYATTSIPPVSSEGTVRKNVPKKLSVTVAAITYLLFGLAVLNASSVWFDPNSASAHLDRGILFSEQEEYDNAVVAYTRAIEVDTDLVDAYIGRGEAYRMLGDLDSALANYRQALDLDPASASAFADRGETYRLMEMPEKALEDCHRAIELDSSLSWAYTVRGNVHSDNLDNKEAIADFRKAIRLDPQHYWTYQLLAWELAHSYDEQYRDTKEAIGMAEKACELTDWIDPNTLATLADVCAEDGQFDQAIQYQRSALGLSASETRDEFQNQLDDYERSAAGELPR